MLHKAYGGVCLHKHKWGYLDRMFKVWMTLQDIEIRALCVKKIKLLVWDFGEQN